MKTVTLQINDEIGEWFFGLLARLSRDEIKILDQSEYTSDDEYLRSIPGMVESIREARAEPLGKGIGLDELDW